MIAGAEGAGAFRAPKEDESFEDLARSTAMAPASLQLLTVVEVARRHRQLVEMCSI